MRQKRVIIDLDSILVDLMGAWLNWYNNESGDSLTIDNITTYKIEDHVKPDWRKRIYGFFRPADRYGTEVKPLPGACEALEKLRRNGLDIIIATATAGETANQKYILAKKVAPFLHNDHVIIGARKEVYFGDFFIDDAPKNILSYKRAWPDAHILTISYPYNQDCRTKVHLMADDHNNTAAAWERIVNHILIHKDDAPKEVLCARCSA